MGSNKVDCDIVFAEVDFEDGLSQPASVQQQQMNRKHRRKKVAEDNIEPGATYGHGGVGVRMTNGDADIVTPYQNGHYNGANHNGYHRARLPHHRHSGVGEDVEDQLDDQLQQVKDYPSPLRLQHLLLDEQRGVNNAITVAPSRTNLNDSNVFAGGRPPANNPLTNKRPNHHRTNNNRHHQNNRHKGRSRTPDFITTSSNHRLRLGADDLQGSNNKDTGQSILNRIDLSIKKNFGDWDSDDEDDVARKIKNSFGGGGVSNGAKSQKIPYFIPKSVASDSDVVGVMGGRDRADDLNLPRLFKPYESEVTTTRKVLNDKSYKVALSRDNEDPNSILSQAKKTLSFVSGQS